jgi:hypothetical protein
MEVTIKIPDQFVEQLIRPGKDASRVLLEELVDGAYGGGRINSDQVNEILGWGTTAKVDEEINLRERTREVIDQLNPNPRWINDPEQARLHAIADKFVGCIQDPDFPRSDDVSAAIKQILLEKYERSRKTK